MYITEEKSIQYLRQWMQKRNYDHSAGLKMTDKENETEVHSRSNNHTSKTKCYTHSKQAAAQIWNYSYCARQAKGYLCKMSPQFHSAFPTGPHKQDSSYEYFSYRQSFFIKISLQHTAIILPLHQAEKTSITKEKILIYEQLSQNQLKARGRTRRNSETHLPHGKSILIPPAMWSDDRMTAPVQSWDLCINILN
jgi:hypothetical protein